MFLTVFLIESVGVLRKIIGSVCTALLVAGPAALADAEWSGTRQDLYAPAGVENDYLPKDGGWVVDYRYSFVHRDGSSGGSEMVHTEQLLQDFTVVPMKMDTQTHAVSLMYALKDALAFVLTVPYERREMDHRTNTGVDFATWTEGIGDVRLTGLISVFEEGGQKVHLHAGFSLPTGSVRERGDTPSQRNAKLPYPMQLGSGTFDLLPGLTYSARSEKLSWGAQLAGTVRTGTNSEKYRLGHAAEASGWTAVRLKKCISASVRLKGSFWGDINGSDPELNPANAPTEDPRRRGGTRVDAGMGLNLHGPKGRFEDWRFGVEGMWPLYQRLEGPQLEREWVLSVGLQAAF